jgi:uncharacterized protein YhbP (UPF0306 family)
MMLAEVTVDSIQDSYYIKLYNMTLGFEKSHAWQAVQFIRAKYPSWQYNGVSKFDEIMIWCEHKFGDYWVWYNETFYFYKEEDKTLFLLKWS